MTPAGDSSEQESPCDSQEEEPLALLFLVHANPVGWHAVVQKGFLGPHGPGVK